MWLFGWNFSSVIILMCLYSTHKSWYDVSCELHLWSSVFIRQFLNSCFVSKSIVNILLNVFFHVLQTSAGHKVSWRWADNHRCLIGVICAFKQWRQWCWEHSRSQWPSPYSRISTDAGDGGTNRRATGLSIPWCRKTVTFLPELTHQQQSIMGKSHITWTCVCVCVCMCVCVCVCVCVFVINEDIHLYDTV